MTYLSHSPEQTKKIAADVAKTLHGGEVIALEGELGTGKTTFVQGLAEALGAEGSVRSPTFAIMNVYRITKGKIRELVHLDCYRLKHPDEIAHLGLEDWLGKKDTIVVIEWPNVVAGVSWTPTKTIRLQYVSEKERMIDIV